jgi:hypothetical protein
MHRTVLSDLKDWQSAGITGRSRGRRSVGAWKGGFWIELPARRPLQSRHPGDGRDVVRACPDGDGYCPIGSESLPLGWLDGPAHCCQWNEEGPPFWPWQNRTGPAMSLLPIGPSGNDQSRRPAESPMRRGVLACARWRRGTRHSGWGRTVPAGRGASHGGRSCQ